MKNMVIGGVLFALLGLAVRPAVAQKQDAGQVLRAAAAAMGADNLKSIRYSGAGNMGLVGQNYSTNTDWPRVELSSYTRTIDYDSKSSKEEMVRVQGRNPARGGGGIPLAGEQRIISLVNGAYAWNMQGSNVNPQPAAADVRQLEIWLTPHGFLKAALMASNPIAVSRIEEGRRVNVVSITLGKYRINGMISGDNLVERIETWIPHPVLGDMLYEFRYTLYKDFGGIRFPSRIHNHQEGDAHRDDMGANLLTINVDRLEANVPDAALSVPDPVRQATIPPNRVESQKLAGGVWLLGGGSHNSVAVEFRDFVAVVEAPLNEERSLAVIEEVRKLIPDKRIKYLVNTHHHYDHLGGVRTYAALGIPIVANRENLDFYRQFLFGPVQRTLMPDLLSLQPRIRGLEPIIETVVEKYVLSDGERTMEIHSLAGGANTLGVGRVEGIAHTANMLIAYLPKERIVVEADLYTPPAAGAQSTSAPRPDTLVFYEAIKRLNLDVAQIVPLHGRVVPMDEFVKFVGTASARQRQ